MYYSKTTRGFYSSDVNTNIPEDAVEVSTEEWQALLEGQAAGQVIVPDAEGYPHLEAAPGPTDEQKKANCKATASGLLKDTDWTTIPDVGNPAVSSPYLVNVQDFVTYRNQVRTLAVYPVTDPIWPPIPVEVWQTT